MQKVHTINLGGIIFQIEEDAYEILKNYLSALRNHFKNQAEGSEIANDIEYRLGEMLNQKLVGGKILIMKADVESIISVMGQPTDFDSEESDQKTSKAYFQKEEEKISRKFFRDTEGRIVGGVSTGLAAYFGIEAWIIRILFLVSLFFGGAGLLIYIILWIAVPKAKTTADRLAMKGEKPTLDNIVKSVEDRAKDLDTGKITGFLKKIADFVTVVLKGIIKAFGKVIGFLVLFISGILLLSLLVISHLTSYGGITINNTTVGLDELLSVIYSDPSDILFIRIIAFVLLSIPLLYLLLGGLTLIGSRPKINKYVHYAAITIWFFGLLLGAYFGIKTAYDFTAESGSTQTINISTVEGEILEIIPFESENNTSGKLVKIYEDKSGFVLSDSGLYIMDVELEIEKSKTNEIELVYKPSARGRNEAEAVKNYKNIVYKYSKVDNNLLLDDFYKLNPGTQFRAQSVKLILRLPEGQQIKLDPFIERLSLNLNDDDFDYDRDEIAGKILMMSEGGLKCLDCEPKMQNFAQPPIPPVPPFSEELADMGKRIAELAKQAQRLREKGEMKALKEVEREMKQLEKEMQELEVKFDEQKEEE